MLAPTLAKDPCLVVKIPGPYVLYGRNWVATNGCHRGAAPDEGMQDETLVLPPFVKDPPLALRLDVDVAEKGTKTLTQSPTARSAIGIRNAGPRSSRKQPIEGYPTFSSTSPE